MLDNWMRRTRAHWYLMRGEYLLLGSCISFLVAFLCSWFVFFAIGVVGFFLLWVFRDSASQPHIDQRLMWKHQQALEEGGTVPANLAMQAQHAHANPQSALDPTEPLFTVALPSIVGERVQLLPPVAVPPTAQSRRITESPEELYKSFSDVDAFAYHAGTTLDRWRTLNGQRVTHATLGQGIVEDVQPRTTGGVLLLIRFGQESHLRRFDVPTFCDPARFSRVELPTELDIDAVRGRMWEEQQERERERIRREAVNRQRAQEAVVRAMIIPRPVLNPSVSLSMPNVAVRVGGQYRRLNGGWHDGWALDLHTTSSVLLDNGQFDNTYTVSGALLHELKYHGDRSGLDKLSDSLAVAISTLWGDLSLAAIIPIPPSKPRQSQPVFMLAACVGRKTGILVAGDYLHKVKATPELKDVSAADRKHVLQGAMQVRDKRFSGEHVLLLDDLYRSGATLQAATELLILQGRIERRFVHVLTVTQTRVNR